MILTAVTPPLVMTVASIGSAYEEAIIDSGNQPLFLMLVAFGVTFGLTRFITHSIRTERFSWLGNVEAGDTHIHHLVWGIVLLLLSGVLAVVVQPPLEVTGIVFGIGAALTLDEFALWLHLEDVYWSEQGRQSIDAVIVFAVITGFMLLGAYPVTVESADGIEGIIGVLIAQALLWTFVAICFLKGKLMWGVFGIYIGPVGIIGATRLAKPDSWWARNRYDAEKLARSRERYGAEEKVHKPAAAG
ncbi:MAG TPA: hypothetical protein VKA36_00100 [Solirubrobacterales bacterium]|nr:hypothetical protein [Solirubrobacterales bacterium]